MALTPESGLYWPLSKGPVMKGAQNALDLPGIDWKFRATAFAAPFLYHNLGSKHTSIEGFPLIVSNPELEQLFLENGPTPRRYPDLYDPINEEVEKFIAGLIECPYQRALIAQVQDLKALAEIMRDTRIEISHQRVGSRSAIQKVTLLG